MTGEQYDGAEQRPAPPPTEVVVPSFQTGPAISQASEPSASPFGDTSDAAADIAGFIAMPDDEMAAGHLDFTPTQVARASRNLFHIGVIDVDSVVDDRAASLAFLAAPDDTPTFDPALAAADDSAALDDALDDEPAPVLLTGPAETGDAADTLIEDRFHVTIGDPALDAADAEAATVAAAGLHDTPVVIPPAEAQTEPLTPLSPVNDDEIITADGDDESALLLPAMAAAAAARAGTDFPSFALTGPPPPTGRKASKVPPPGPMAYQTPTPWDDEEKPRRRGKGGRRRTGAVLGLVVALLALTGAAGWAYVTFAASGDQPEAVIPASAAAYIKIDLDPPAGQKADIVRLASKANSDGNDPVDVDEIVDDLLTSALPSTGAITYNDIKPWLGDRASLAVVPGPAATPAVVLAVQTTDPAAAEASLTKITSTGTGTAYTIRDGYVLLADSAASLTAYTNALDAAPLTDDPTWQQDMDALGIDQIVVVRADLPALTRLAGQAAANALNQAGALPLPIDATTLPAQGRLVVGVHATPDAIEISGFLTDQTGTATTGDGLIRTLPADTAVAGTLHNLSELLATNADTGTNPGTPDLTAALASIGLTTDDLTNINSGDLVVASNGTDLGVLSATDDTAAATSTIATIQQRLVAPGDTPLSVAAEPSTGKGTVYAATTPAYLETLQTPTKTLGDDPVFRAAVQDPSAPFVLFADVDSLAPLFGGVSLGLPNPTDPTPSPVQAFGVSAWNGPTSKFTIRIVLAG